MRGLTIGQAAAYVGVTVKTVRHYHRLGLLTEPRRDASGYRRYDSSDLLRLAKVRALADAGVALGRIDDLLDADPERFAETVQEAGRRLEERIAELTARREALRWLADGDRALLPERACAVLARLADAGLPRDLVDAEREALVLARAVAPAFLEGYLAQLERRVDDPEYVELRRCGWEALSWQPDDPRLEELARRIADNLLTERELMEAQAGFFDTADAVSRYQLINRHRVDDQPTLARMKALVEDRLRAGGLSLPE